MANRREGEFQRVMTVINQSKTFPLKPFPPDFNSCDQCDQIGQFLKGVCDNFSRKYAQIASDFLGYFGKGHCLSQNCSCFFTTGNVREQFSLLFIPSSGYTGPYVRTEKRPKRQNFLFIFTTSGHGLQCDQIGRIFKDLGPQ